MNIYQNFNNWASGFIFGAVLTGLWRLLGDAKPSWGFLAINADSLFLVIFIVFFRAKMHLDDHKYFKNFEVDRSRYKYHGFLIAIAVWFFMAISAGTIKDAEQSAAFLAVAFGLSTIWIAVHLMEIALSSENRAGLRAIAALRHKWVVINGCYITLLVLYSQNATISLGLGGDKYDLSKWMFIALMIVIMICDHYLSDPHSEGPLPPSPTQPS